MAASARSLATREVSRRPSASSRVFGNDSASGTTGPSEASSSSQRLLPDQEGQGFLEPLQPALLGLGRRQPRPRPLEAISAAARRAVSCSTHSALCSDGLRLTSLAFLSSASPALIRGFEPPGLNRASISRSSCALHLQQVLQAAAGLEEQGTQLAPSLEDRLAPLDQLVVIEGEPALELGFGQAVQERPDRLVGQRSRPVGRQQRVAVPLAADEPERPAVAAAQGQPDPHLRIRMDEIVGRLRRDAEERLPQPPQRRRLARLVRPEDQVQPLLAAGEVEHDVGERAEGIQGELEDLHASQ